MLYKRALKEGVASSGAEKHFHDHDETWLVLSGTVTSFWIDHSGARKEFELEAGDAWVIPAGYEHGTVDSSAQGFELTWLFGTIPEGSHSPGHYYVEEEGYIPSLELVKSPTDRYKRGEPPKSATDDT